MRGTQRKEVKYMDNCKELSSTRSLTEVQAIMWNIVKEVKPFLDENQLQYFILGGTLLGAVRHKGFIPWDEDFDIGIPREDYGKFLKGIARKLPEHLRVVTFDPNDGNLTHHFYFSRIVDTRYVIKRTGSMVEREEFVWIDIFPLDGMPRNWFKRKLHLLNIVFTRGMYHVSTIDKVNLKRPGRTIIEKAIIKFVLITKFGKNSDMFKWLHRLDKVLCKYPYQSSDWMINGTSAYIREYYKREVFGDGALYEFEDAVLTGPADAAAYLAKLYGDYMTPPPNSSKDVHSAMLVK